MLTISWTQPNGEARQLTLQDLQSGAPVPCETPELTLKRTGAKDDAGFEVKPEVLRALMACGKIAAFEEDLKMGASIELALRARLDDFTINYTHCGTSWDDRHSCACNDECPCCGAEIEPETFDQVAGMDWEQPAGLMRPPKPAQARRARP